MQHGGTGTWTSHGCLGTCYKETLETLYTHSTPAEMQRTLKLIWAIRHEVYPVPSGLLEAGPQSSAQHWTPLSLNSKPSQPSYLSQNTKEGTGPAWVRCSDAWALVGSLGVESVQAHLSLQQVRHTPRHCFCL